MHQHACKAIHYCHLYRTAILIFLPKRYECLLYLTVYFLLNYKTKSKVHFGLTKFNSQTEKVPLGAPFYDWKVGVPTFEFGMMHAILFQLAVRPLTMCRLSIASMSDTLLARILPLNGMTTYHIAIGYVLVTFLLSTIIVFFIFFGVLCNSGNKTFCDKVSVCMHISIYITSRNALKLI
jgi:hypothetical protein